MEQPSHSDSMQKTGERWFASAIFLAGLITVVGVLIGRDTSPSWMPRSWYINRPLWFAAGIGLTVLGFALMRRSRSDSSLSPFQTVTFYTRDGCHLCDEAFEVLKEFRDQLPTIEVVDIDREPEFVEKFDTCVPVVEIDGRVRFRGRVTRELLQRLIRGATTQAKKRPAS